MSSEDVCPPLNIEKCSLVLVDVAGTTTSINFVKDTLFPYFLKHIDTFLQANWEKEEVKAALKQLKDEELEADAAATLIKSLTEEDSANPGLKTLQGFVYQEGYEKKDLKAHIFEDVKEAFETWAKSRHISIYSTGSVDSQKLLFKHTVSGDLSGLIHNYYDQEIGSKTEAESYKKIAEDAKVELQEVVFITDDVKEATAAKSGGVHAVLIKREGNASFPKDLKDFHIISSFTELLLEKAPKRKIEEEQTPSEAPPSKVPKTNPEEKEERAPVEEKLEIIEEEMEIDETKTATKETEVENAPEKTETEIKEVEVEKETTCKDTEMKEEVKETTCVDTEMKEKEKEKETTCKDTEEEVKETTCKDTEMKEKETASEVAEVNEKTETQSAEEPQPTASEEKTDATSSVEEAKPEEEETKEETAVVEEKPADAQVTEEKPEETEKKVEETPTSTEETKTEETASDETKEEKTIENGDAKPEEEAETSTPKVEEKENKSVLANGVENGNKGEEKKEENETTEVSAEKEAEKEDEQEVKVKKLEESAESKTVSVEV